MQKFVHCIYIYLLIFKTEFCLCEYHKNKEK